MRYISVSLKADGDGQIDLPHNNKNEKIRKLKTKNK